MTASLKCRKDPPETMAKVDGKGVCAVCGEPGSMFLDMHPGSEQSVLMCRECTVLSYPSHMRSDEWVAFPSLSNQNDILKHARLLSALRYINPIVQKSKTARSTTAHLTRILNESLPSSLRLKYDTHTMHIIGIMQDAQDKLSGLERIVMKSARNYEILCWREYHVHPLHADAPCSGVLYWPLPSFVQRSTVDEYTRSERVRALVNEIHSTVNKKTETNKNKVTPAVEDPEGPEDSPLDDLHNICSTMDAPLRPGPFPRPDTDSDTDTQDEHLNPVKSDSGVQNNAEEPAVVSRNVSSEWKKLFRAAVNIVKGKTE